MMYGQNEIASVPKATMKITTTMGKGRSSRRWRTLNVSTPTQSAPITGKMNKYGRVPAPPALHGDQLRRLQRKGAHDGGSLLSLHIHLEEQAHGASV